MSKKINNILLSVFPVAALFAHSYYNNFVRSSKNLLDKYDPLIAVGKMLSVALLIAFVCYFLFKKREYSTPAVIAGCAYIIVFLLPKILCYENPEICESFYIGNWVWYIGLVFLALYGFMIIKNYKKAVIVEK